MDYEKRYNDALRRAKKLYEQGTITESLGWVFPELKESEDEKMRKSIIYALRNGGFYSKDKTDEAIAWLEKQGHMLDADKVIEWLKANVYDDSAYGKEMIEKFKKDFGL